MRNVPAVITLLIALGLATLAWGQQEPARNPTEPIAGSDPVTQSTAVSTRTTTVSTTSLNPWVWYGTPAAFLFAVVAALVVYGVVSRRGKSQRPQKMETEVSDEPYAYLVLKGDDQTRYPIMEAPWRIGRGSNNDLTIPDHSVSRQHAEIHMNAKGAFRIVDLESLNGVYVNDKKVRSKHILEGDVIDVGDVSFRFTLKIPQGGAQEAPTRLSDREPSDVH